MDEIAAAAGTSKPIVYRYFEDKAGLQVAVAELVLADITAALDAAATAASTPREGLRSMIDGYLAMVEHSPNVYHFVTRQDASGKVGHFLEAVSRLVAAPFSRLIAGEQGRDEVVEAWAAGAVGFVRGLGEWWLSGPAGLERHELAELATQWLWTGPVAAGLRTSTRTTTSPREDAGQKEQR